MVSKPYPPDVLEQAREVSGAWKKIDPTLKIGALDRARLEAKLAQTVPLQVQMNELDAQLTDLRNQRDSLYNELWDQVKRVRSGIKGIYGDDSSQYEMVGGTRRSERKPRARPQPSAPAN